MELTHPLVTAAVSFAGSGRGVALAVVLLAVVGWGCLALGVPRGQQRRSAAGVDPGSDTDDVAFRSPSGDADGAH